MQKIVSVSSASTISVFSVCKPGSVEHGKHLSHVALQDDTGNCTLGV